MGQIQLQGRPLGYDTGRIDLRMAAVVVVLDVLEVHGLGDPRPLIQLPQPAL